VRNIKRLFLLVLLLGSVADSHAESGYEYFEKLGSNLLRGKSTGGFSEYEFFPDGRLIAYSYLKDGTDSGPDVADNTVLPKFQIDFFRWEIKGKDIFFNRGNRRFKSEIWNDETHVYFNDKSWDIVKRLEFFDQVSKYTGNNIILEGLEKKVPQP